MAVNNMTKERAKSPDLEESPLELTVKIIKNTQVMVVAFIFFEFNFMSLNQSGSFSNVYMKTIKVFSFRV